MESLILKTPFHFTPRSTVRRSNVIRHQGRIAGYRDYASGEVTEQRSEQVFEHDLVNGEWDVKSWASAIKNPQEVADGFWVTDIEGEIPTELTGTYYRNGPGEFESFGVEVVHPFDAQGYIGSLAIKNGRAFFRSRYVQTVDSLLEEKAKRRLFRGAFGTAPKEGVNPMFHLKSRNAGNTNLAIHNGRLYPLYEGFTSSEMCPYTLETLHPKLSNDFIYDSLSLWRQLVESAASFIGPDAINGTYLDFKTKETSAHPHKDYDRDLNILHNYTVKPVFGNSGISTKLDFFEFRDNLKIEGQTDTSLENFCMIHDIGFTENYFVFFNSPCKVNAAAMLDSKHGLVNCIEWDENGVQEIHLVPRPSAKKKNLKHRVIEVKDRLSFVFHFINAFEDGDEIIIDAIHYPKLLTMKFSNKQGERYYNRKDIGPIPKPEARRIVCDANGVKDYNTIHSRSVEFATVNPKNAGKPHKYFYASACLHPSDFLEFQAIGKVDMETGGMKLWVKDQSYFIGETAFVPKPEGVDEDDGWVLAFGYDGTNKRTEFVILDAKKIEDGPIATLNLGLTIPHGLHGMWTEDYYGPN